jgi:hypothetical protein
MSEESWLYAKFPSRSKKKILRRFTTSISITIPALDLYSHPDFFPCSQSHSPSSIPIPIFDLDSNPNPYSRSGSQSQYLFSISNPVLVLNLDLDPYPIPTLHPQSWSWSSNLIPILDLNSFPRSSGPNPYPTFGPYPRSRSAIPIAIHNGVRNRGSRLRNQGWGSWSRIEDQIEIEERNRDRGSRFRIGIRIKDQDWNQG